MRLVKVTFFLVLVLAFYNFGKMVLINITSISLPQGLVVFSSCVRGNCEVYTMRLNGTNIKQLTKYGLLNPTFETQIVDLHPSFSADGKKIVFSSDRDAPGSRWKVKEYPNGLIHKQRRVPFCEIYIMDSNGRHEMRLTYDQIRNGLPKFSENKHRILFRSVLSTENPFYEELKLIDESGIDKQFLACGNRIAELAKFSPNGRDILFVDKGDINSINVETREIRRLTYFNKNDIDAPNKVENIPFVNNFTISPDGTKIILVVSTKNSREFIFYSVKIDGALMQEILRLRNPDQKGYLGFIQEMKCSPNGQSVAFVGDFGIMGPSIYVFDLNNGKILINRSMGSDSKIESNGLMFTPDSQQVLFVTSFSYALFNDWNVRIQAGIHNALLTFNYLFFKRIGAPYDYKYLCIMNVNGGDYYRITKFPPASVLGYDFIHFETEKSK